MKKLGTMILMLVAHANAMSYLSFVFCNQELPVPATTTETVWYAEVWVTPDPGVESVTVQLDGQEQSKAVSGKGYADFTFVVEGPNVGTPIITQNVVNPNSVFVKERK